MKKVLIVKDSQRGKVMNWNDFREACRDDAYLWHDNGWKSSEITAENILNEYPDDYFAEYTSDDLSDDAVDYSTDNFFEPDDFANKTIEYMKELEDDEQED